MEGTQLVCRLVLARDAGPLYQPDDEQEQAPEGGEGRRARPAALTLDDPLAAQSRRMLRRMPEFAVTAIGRDRPGIVAAISKALLDLNGNIEDSQMSILRGHFAVMLIVKLPEAVEADDLDGRLQRCGGSSSWRRSP